MLIHQLQFNLYLLDSYYTQLDKTLIFFFFSNAVKNFQ